MIKSTLGFISQLLLLSGSTGELLRRTSAGIEWATITQALRSLNGSTGELIQRTSGGVEWETITSILRDLNGNTGEHLRRTSSGIEWSRVMRGVTILPSSPSAYDCLFYVGDTYRAFSGWDTGISGPTDESTPTGLARDPFNDNLILVGSGTDKIYTYANGSWNSGLAIPAEETNPQGVAVNSNGSVNEVVLRRSSGHRILDDAAIRIVKLAAPFAPLPAKIRREADILHIERTWHFLSSNRLTHL